MDIKTIAQYYDYMLPFYKLLWHVDSESHALHYGFWYKGTRTLKQALLNTNGFLAEKAQIRPDAKILDAGCGIGGSSIWIAKNLKANVVGLALTEKEINKAKRLSRLNGTDKLTTFFVRDFIRTEFEEESFDIIWAIESICHAADKKRFLTESFRILKKHGRIVLADGFLLRGPRDEKERQFLEEFLEGLVLPNLANTETFKKDLETAGFRNVRMWEKTQEILPSSKRIYIISRFCRPLFWALQKLRITTDIATKNSLAGIAGMAGYEVFYGEK
jgi:cyclopropane fatty-acyl-phospholipid synthase-like methyltransferase